jgi:hypothetical protein
MRRGRKTESAAARRARQHFTETVLERERCEIQDLIPHECGGGCFDACHVLPKRFIKRETNTLSEEDQIAAMWDVANGLKGCRLGHNLFDSAGHCGLTVEDLPAAAVRFAADYGWRFELEREYAGDRRMAA